MPSSHSKRFFYQFLSSLPPATNGMALGLSGFISLWRTVGNSDFSDAFDSNGSLTITIVGSAFALSTWWLFAYFLKALLCPRVVWDELQTPGCIASLCCWPVAVGIWGCLPHDHIWSGSYVWSAEVSFGIMVVAQLLYQILSGLFVWRCVEFKAHPEPFWAPGIIGLVLWAMQLGPLQDRGLHLTDAMKTSVQVDFVLGCGCCAVLAPCILYRTIKHARSVACGPAVAIVMAPFSFIAVTYFNSNQIIGLPHWAACPVFVLSTLGFLGSLFCGLHWRRREMIFHHPFNPTFAGLTFPLCTTGICALRFSKWAGDPLPLRVYALTLSLFSLLLVLAINMRYIVYICMMACRAVEVARPRALSQDQMNELLLDGADKSLLDYRKRGQLISWGRGESFFCEPLHDCVGFDIVRLRDTRGRPLLSEIVEIERERSQSDQNVRAIYPSASDVERMVYEVSLSPEEKAKEDVEVVYSTSVDHDSTDLDIRSSI